MKVSEKFCYHIPDVFADESAAPLLCAGAIGYRSLRLTELKNGQNLGLTGFGASGHLVLKMSKFLFPQSAVMVFARNEQEQIFARSLGASWAGGILDEPPSKLHAIIDTTPAWTPVIESLRCLQSGGRLVINAIRKESIDQNVLLKLSYPTHLWMEKEIKSVANITRKDVLEFFELAAKIPIQPEVEIYPFGDANKAILDLKHRHVKGAKVLRVS
jgi:propanol-preferring alcohol dehydrogenase